jgi:hypothetical protein
VRIPLIAAAAILLSLGARPSFAQILIAPSPYSRLFVHTLGTEVTDMISPKLTAVEVTMSCGRYTELEASYSNGMIKSKEIPGDEATQVRLGGLFASNPAIVSVVDEPCME